LAFTPAPLPKIKNKKLILNSEIKKQIEKIIIRNKKIYNT
jgi:hypothetical protein